LNKVEKKEITDQCRVVKRKKDEFIKENEKFKGHKGIKSGLKVEK
jgi:hypothetical protein